MIGKTLNHYEIVEKLGSGGMGEVWAAEDTKLHRRVAIKVLPEEMAQDPERLKRFNREAQAVAALNHPNIVTIFSVEEDDGLQFLTMELVNGETLDSAIPEGGLKLNRFFDLSIRMVDALSAAHERGIVHRDLKPGNVMVTPEGRVKILDFGLAKLQDGGDPSNPFGSSTQTLTQEGSILGTVAFMSPEQLQGREPDTRSDIFSLGIVLYQMATGERPFDGESSADLISCILRDDPPVVSDLKLSIPKHLGRIVKRCLDKDPERRYQSAADVARDLEDLRDELDSGTLKTQAVAGQRGREPKSKAPWLIAGGMILALLAAWGFVQMRSPEAVPEALESDSAALLGDTPSIAVMPFENLGPTEAAEPFVEGLNAEVRTHLTSTEGVTVLEGDRLDLEPGADQPPVAGYALEGSVQWGDSSDDGQRLRMTFDLTNLVEGHLIFSESYDRQSGDLFEVQTKIAKLLSRKISLTVLGLEVGDLGLDLEGFRPPEAEKERVTRPRPATPRPQTPAAPTVEEPAPAAPESVQEAPPPVTPIRGTVKLRVELTTFLPRGVLTLFQDNDRILQETFRFKPKELPGQFITQIEVPASMQQLRVYVAPRKKSAEVVVLETDLTASGNRRLLVVVNESGKIDVELSR